MQLISAAESAVPTVGSDEESIRMSSFRAWTATRVDVVSAGTAATVGSISIAKRYSWLCNKFKAAKAKVYRYAFESLRIEINVLNAPCRSDWADLREGTANFDPTSVFCNVLSASLRKLTNL